MRGRVLVVTAPSPMYTVADVAVFVTTTASRLPFAAIIRVAEVPTLTCPVLFIPKDIIYSLSCPFKALARTEGPALSGFKPEFKIGTPLLETGRLFTAAHSFSAFLAAGFR